MLKWFGVILNEVVMIFVCGIHDCRDSGHTVANLELHTERHWPQIFLRLVDVRDGTGR